MNLTFECPKCKKKYQLNSNEVAEKSSPFKCSECDIIPPPDIMTAYQNVGKTMKDLSGCCDCNDEKDGMPKEIKKI